MPRNRLYNKTKMVSQSNIKYPNLLATVFTSSFLKQLINGTHKKHLLNLLECTGFNDLIEQHINMAELLNRIYNILLSTYRCEYIYKNTIANQLLLKRHSQDGTKLLTEFRASKAKADVVILNGTSNAYEIKTELDSLSRLESQINSYRKLFDKIYVVTNPIYLKKISDTLSDDIGILCLSQSNSLDTIRESASNKQHIDLSAIFDSLRKEEYCNIINNTYGYLPPVSNAHIYNACKQLFCDLPPLIAHEKMIYELKKRNDSSFVIDFLSSVPESIRLLCINSKLPLQNHHLLQQRLSEVLN